MALCGGIGGAKLALGLSHILEDRLCIVVNTGDDFHLFGLQICPDLDTVIYTLAGLANPATGWGRADESWRCMETIEALGGESWFRLGDTDLAMHAVRTEKLAQGCRLTEVTEEIRERLGVASRVLPAADIAIPTLIETDRGTMPFQHYFVRERCTPVVRGFVYAGAAAAPSPEVVAALTAPDLQAVIICPSNPYLSIDPMLAIAQLRRLVVEAAAPVVAISPIVGGKAVKGPLAKIMAELGIPVAAASITAHYGDLLDAFVADPRDATPRDLTPPDPAVTVLHTNTLMVTLDDRIALARFVLQAAAELQK